MRLKAESVKELPKEFADWKAESTLEVSDEYNVFAEFRLGSYLEAGSSALHALRDPAAVIQPLYLG